MEKEGDYCMSKTIYFDNSATTKVRKEVLEKMIPYFSEYYGNPSSIYKIAKETRRAVDTGRTQIAKAINADDNEIYFTAGGSESDNWAIKGIAESYADRGKHIITLSIEHHAILHACQALEQQGYEVTYLSVQENGIVDLEVLKKAIREDTILISVMFANNEIGSIQPIAAIGEIAKEHNIVFHTDAVQAAGHLPIDVKTLHIDLLSMASHKFYGPKGIGVLYIRKGIKLNSYIHGGGQEKGKRAGTENIAGIVGMGEALELVTADLEEENIRLVRLRDKLINGVLSEIPYTKLNGDKKNRLPGNANFAFEFVEGESILLTLDQLGICASSGSACTSGSLDPSHVLLAIGLLPERAHGSLRISLGKYNTDEEVDFLLEKLPEVIKKLRSMSPLYAEFAKHKHTRAGLCG
jgi:cysteine desulfurase